MFRILDTIKLGLNVVLVLVHDLRGRLKFFIEGFIAVELVWSGCGFACMHAKNVC